MNEFKNREAMSNYLPLYIKNKRLGKVHSKFKNGLNIEFDDFIIFINSISLPLSAFGCKICTDKLRKILDNIEIGNVVINKDGRFIFYGLNEIIEVEYKNIFQVDLRIPKILSRIDQVSNTKLYKQLEKIRYQENIGLELDERTIRYINLLSDSDKNNNNLNLEIINFFTGRGKGLTPSGDDIILGFSLALRAFDKFPAWLDSIRKGLDAYSSTSISKAYLKAFIDGYISENYIGLIKLLDKDDKDAIDKVLMNLQSFGHTSGYDTLYGFYLGLIYLTKYIH